MADWYRHEDERRSRGGREDFGSESHGGSGRDRGAFERGVDEVRSWFGDEEAEQRRRRDMPMRDRDFDVSRNTRGEFYRPDLGAPGTHPYRQRSAHWRDIDSDEDAGFVGRTRAREREVEAFTPPRRTYASEEWMIPGPFVGQGPKGYQRSDERILEDVCERLTQDGRIDARTIEVSVTHGEVTLRGTVGDRRAKRMAEDVAESVSGVRDVSNELRVSTQPGTGAEAAQAGIGVRGLDTEPATAKARSRTS